MVKWNIDPALGVLLEALGQQPRRLFGATKRRPDPDLFERIADRGQVGALPYLLPFTLSRDREEALAAATAVQRLVEPLIPRYTAALDEWLRSGGRYYAPVDADWLRLTPRGLPRLSQEPGGHGEVLIAVASCHHNGYVRQTAAEQLRRVGANIALPFLLVRVNDWVAAVRDTARESLSAFLAPAFALELVRCLGLVKRLQGDTRVNHSALIERIEGVLTSVEARSALEHGAGARDVTVRRYSHRLLLASGHQDAFPILCAAIDDADPVLAHSALRAGPGMLAPDSLTALLRRALRSRLALVRVSALRLVAEHLPGEAVRLHRELLIDRATSVRAQAQWFVRRETDDDLRDYYRARFKEGNATRLASALHGIGETGSADDAAIVSPHLAHAAARVRAAAIGALRRLAPAESVDHFLAAVRDPSGRVSRAAQGGLLETRSQLDIDDLWTALTSTPRPHVRRHLLSVIAQWGQWDAIPYLLRALDMDDERLDAQSRRYLRRWVVRSNREFVPPRSEQLTAFREALADHGAGLDAETRSALSFILRTTAR